ncbi:MAG: hypothetical protein AB7G48_06490 [Nitrospiraceae bacterium]
MVQRIWEAHGLQPHRVRPFKLSRDLKFLQRLTDVMGLYVNLPNKALLLCVDEKRPIQALDQCQSGLPMNPGRCGTMTHDDERQGTTTSLAALNVLNGTIMADCMLRQRHQELLRFLLKLD